MEQLKCPRCEKEILAGSFTIKTSVYQIDKNASLYVAPGTWINGCEDQNTQEYYHINCFVKTMLGRK
jgi:hypothetical protein